MATPEDVRQLALGMAHVKERGTLRYSGILCAANAIRPSA